MSTLILCPLDCNRSYQKAALIFQEMYQKVTSLQIPIAETDDQTSDLFVIGSDSINNFVLNEMLQGHIPSFGIRYGTDDYSILSYTQGRRIVILAGGRLRSTLYAIYDFFERFADCHYFWDGDIIPHKDNILLPNFHITESPRFAYRGLRYFAHRGLKRFQAEHWSFEDWKAELDWLTKKRLNFFMLRIGMDDLWQRAFPDTVTYPKGYQNIENMTGYDDRSDFWTLKYRGELREKILGYARELDLIHPTDCGTMTHWYSRTPEEFLSKIKPSFLPYCGHRYTQNDTGKVFDFREAKNLRNYMQLTQTMVNEYEKQTGFFHTIGLGERTVFPDSKKNHTLKLIAYRKIAESLRTLYPDAKLFVASWDFACLWTGDEVKALISELDPENTIILDYTSEMNDPEQSFLHWGVVNHFPWVFGLFHAYESESELRGPYERTNARLEIASEDPYCKGMILWPELSHSDPIVLEYLSENAWSPLQKTTEEMVTAFCQKRYGNLWSFADACWQKFLPFMMQGDWGGFSVREDADPLGTEYYSSHMSHGDLWVKPFRIISLKDDVRFKKQTALKINKAKVELSHLIELANAMATFPEALQNPFFKRDSIDMVRTILGRFLNFLMESAVYDTDAATVEAKKSLYLTIIDLLKEVLSLSKDFSLLDSLYSLQAVAPTNPTFEKTLKQNIGCDYCRQYCFELTEALFKKEALLIFDWILDGKREDAIPIINEAKQNNFELFLETPLVQYQPHIQKDAAEIIRQVAIVLESLRNML